MTKPFSQHVSEFRRRHRITQAELAGALDVSMQTVCNWERGRNEPWNADAILMAMESIGRRRGRPVAEPIAREPATICERICA